MPRKKQAENGTGCRIINPESGIKILSQQLEEGRAMLTRPELEEAPYDVWVYTTTDYIARAFGEDSRNVERFTDTIAPNAYFAAMEDEADSRRHRREDLVRQITYLEGMVKMLEKDIELRSPAPRELAPVAEAVSKGVFIVHGRDNGAKDTVARFVEKLGLEVVILHEKPSRGRPILEKFMDHAQEAGYAIVIMTPDDKGGLATEPADNYSFRARQNVVFELGFFLAQLGRGKVCALYSPGVEIPSDYKGVGYLELDAKGAWRAELAKEIRAAGIEINLKALAGD
ncbi:MAG TPA: nucleotide-binding protein [Clostridia bacterium]|nr:nucleotide-binding protein [Clostridia bacterium]